MGMMLESAPCYLLALAWPEPSATRRPRDRQVVINRNHSRGLTRESCQVPR